MKLLSNEQIEALDTFRRKLSVASHFRRSEKGHAYYKEFARLSDRIVLDAVADMIASMHGYYDVEQGYALYNGLRKYVEELKARPDATSTLS